MTKRKTDFAFLGHSEDQIGLMYNMINVKIVGR
jgi:hypothetical protein